MTVRPLPQGSHGDEASQMCWRLTRRARSQGQMLDETDHPVRDAQALARRTRLNSQQRGGKKGTLGAGRPTGNSRSSFGCSTSRRLPTLTKSTFPYVWAAGLAHLMGPHLHELAQCRHMRTVLFSPGSELLGFLYHQHLKRAGQSNPLPTMSSLSEAQLHQDLLLQSQQVCRYPKLLVPCSPRLSRELGALLGYDFHLNPSAGFPHATILSRTKIQHRLSLYCIYFHGVVCRVILDISWLSHHFCSQTRGTTDGVPQGVTWPAFCRRSFSRAQGRSRGQWFSTLARHRNRQGRIQRVSQPWPQARNSWSAPLGVKPGHHCLGQALRVILRCQWVEDSGLRSPKPPTELKSVRPAASPRRNSANGTRCPSQPTSPCAVLLPKWPLLRYTYTQCTMPAHVRPPTNHTERFHHPSKLPGPLGDHGCSCSSTTTCSVPLSVFCLSHSTNETISRRCLMFLRLIQAVICIRGLFLFMWLWIYHHLFICSHVEGHFGWSTCTCMNRGALNTRIHVIFVDVLILSRMPGSSAKCMFNFVRTAKLFSNGMDYFTFPPSM